MQPLQVGKCLPVPPTRVIEKDRQVAPVIHSRRRHSHLFIPQQSVLYLQRTHVEE